MKRLKRIQKRKGFTLTECLIALVIFALMATIVMQILSIAISQSARNHVIDKNMDEQIAVIAQENASLTDRTESIVMNFFTAGGSSSSSLTIGNAKVQNTGLATDNDAYELNTFTATITADPNADDDEEGGGMISDDIHSYGTKGVTSIYIEDQSSKDSSKGIYNMKFVIKITDTNEVLCDAETNSMKISLPASAKKIKYSADSQTLALKLSSSTIRFSDKDISTKEKARDGITITFTLTEEEYAAEYVSFFDYFFAKEPVYTSSELTEEEKAAELEVYKNSNKSKTSATFNDSEIQGIFNRVA